MNLTQILFDVGNAFILPFWFLLIFVPHSRLTKRIFANEKFSPTQVLALLYAVAVLPGMFSNPEVMSSFARPTLDGIRALSQSDTGVAAGWLHYLCFDLFVGITVWKSAQERQQSFKWVSPVMLFVLMLGPVGWLLYSVLSWFLPGTKRAVSQRD